MFMPDSYVGENVETDSTLPDSTSRGSNNLSDSSSTNYALMF